MYIPNTSHWMDYYENLGNNGSNPYINQMNKSGKQIGGGSLVGTPKSFITPIGPAMKDSTNEKIKVQLVSPVQQTEDMARDMVKREKVKMGIKRKSQSSRNSSTKRALKSGTAPIEFTIAAQNSLEYIDLRKTQLYVRARIRHSDGSDLKPTEYVGPVNNFLHSMFSQVDITLQNKLVTSSTAHYPYKAMIQTMLSFGSEAKKSQLTSQLWKKDNAGHFDDNDVKNGGNTALFARSQYFSQSQTCDLVGNLFHDLTSLDRYLLNQITVNVKLWRSKPEFCLMTNVVNPNFQIYIEDICLRVFKLKLNPSVITAHSHKLLTTNAKYPYTRTEVRLISIPAGSLSFNYNNLFNGLRATRCVIGFTDSSSSSGSYALNPFNFQHFNLSQIALKLNQVPVGGNVMQLNFAPTSRTILPSFTSMFEVTNKWMRDSGIDISRNDVSGGTALYCWDIEANFSDEGQYLNLVKQGTCSLEVMFSKPLPKATTCVVYAEFPAYFEVNLERNIILQ
ncbi:uncharacterized protein F54H12.2-like [Mytilus trossulus]|uniref:uncharacterized protein F54H12.2-like n=1 Tax=Mytilus trossulus TaxID=6551 RepID=UPI0030040EF2